MKIVHSTLPPHDGGGPSAGGFTLLEVMIAIAILAITLVAAFQSQSQSIAMATGARNLTTLSLLAQSKMADMEGAEVLSTGQQSGTFGEDFRDYTWRTIVSTAQYPSFGRVEVVVTDSRAASKNTYRLIFYRPMNRKSWP